MSTQDKVAVVTGGANGDAKANASRDQGKLDASASADANGNASVRRQQ